MSSWSARTSTTSVFAPKSNGVSTHGMEPGMRARRRKPPRSTVSPFLTCSMATARMASSAMRQRASVAAMPFLMSAMTSFVLATPFGMTRGSAGASAAVPVGLGIAKYAILLFISVSPFP